MEQLASEVQRLGTTLGKRFILIAESDLNDPKFVRPVEAHGYGMDAQWSDDFHHALFTLLWSDPGRGYYDDFGSMDDLVKSIKGAFVYDGQYSRYRQHSHGRPVEGLSAHHFLGYIQNHDQVGNRATGDRLGHLVGLEASKVALGLTLMVPFIPMLWMGEEFAATSPFLYFADHEEEEMRKLVSEGRKRDFAAFGWDESQIPDPEAEQTFTDSKLNWSEVNTGGHGEMLKWVKDLIHLRRCTVDLNDGDFHHMEASCTADGKGLTMRRGSVRVLMYLGDDVMKCPLLEGEILKLASCSEVRVEGQNAVLPKMSLAILAR